MSFTFDPGLTNKLSIIRFEIGDVQEDGFFLHDESINYFIENFTTGEAIVRCLQHIITQLSSPTFELDWLKVDNETAREGYEKILKQKSVQYGVSISGISASATISLPFRADSHQTDTESLGNP